MINEIELRRLCHISGFRIDAENRSKLLSDMEEIIGIMDKINDFQEDTDYVMAPHTLEELREDKPSRSVITEMGDISVGRVVQSDD